MTESPGEGLLFARVLSTFGKCQSQHQRVPYVALHMPVLLPKDCDMDRKELA